MLAEAERPVIVCQRGDPQGKLAHAVARLARDNAIPVVGFWPVRNVLAGDFPMHGGYDVAPWLEKADVVLAVDAQVPWIQRDVQLGNDARVIHVGPDPLFSNLPVRSFRTDLAIAGDPAVTVTALVENVEAYGIDRSARFAEIEAAGKARRAKAEETARAGGGSPMTPAFVSRCISDVMDRCTVLFTELGAVPAFMDLKHPNCCFMPPYSGGLGWGLPAALGASLADPSRLVIACVGDGSYTFANPVACHQIAEALELPILTIVMNNGLWNAVRRSALAMYPDGKAAAMNRMPITSLAPTPSYTQIAAASRGWSERVESGADLPAALARAIEVVRTERRQALLEVMVLV